MGLTWSEFLNLFLLIWTLNLTKSHVFFLIFFHFTNSMTLFFLLIFSSFDSTQELKIISHMPLYISYGFLSFSQAKSISFFVNGPFELIWLAEKCEVESERGCDCWLVMNYNNWSAIVTFLWWVVLYFTNKLHPLC